MHYEILGGAIFTTLIAQPGFRPAAFNRRKPNVLRDYER